MLLDLSPALSLAYFSFIILSKVLLDLISILIKSKKEKKSISYEMTCFSLSLTVAKQKC